MASIVENFIHFRWILDGNIGKKSNEGMRREFSHKKRESSTINHYCVDRFCYENLILYNIK